MQTKKILVIGSKGFIGSHLFRFFASKDEFDVYGCDIVPNDESSANREPPSVTACADSASYDLSKTPTLDSSRARFGFSSHYFCITNPANPDYEAIFGAEDFSVIINCSGSANVGDSFLQPLNDFSLNTLNVMRMLEAIRKKVPRALFVNLSSAAVYGNPSVLPITEQTACAPVSPYGVHKLCSEHVCREYRDFFGVQTVCLRIFSAYGNGLKKQIFWDITNKALKDDSVRLFGTGHETRDFIHIDDICAAVLAVLDAGNNAPAVLNVANGVQTSVAAIAESVLRALGSTKKVVFSEQNRTGDPIFWQADISALKSLGYTQSVLLKDGIASYVNWARREIES